MKFKFSNRGKVLGSSVLDSKQSSRFEFIKTFDYFGVTQTFRVNSKEKYTSAFGGMAFFTYLFIAVGYISFSFKEYVGKEKKNVIMSQQQIIPAPDINMKKLNFTLAFGIAFDSNNSIAYDNLSQYLDYSYNLVTLQNGTKTKAQIATRLCDYSDFPFASVKAIDQLQLNKYMCTNDSMGNITLKGLYNDEVFQYLEYTVSLKKNIFQSPDKLNQLKRILEDDPIKFNSYFTDISLNVNNITNPTDFFINSFTNYLDYRIYQKQNLDFIILNFTDDQNIILQHRKSKSFGIFNSECSYYFGFEDRNLTSNGDRFNLYRVYVRTNPKVSVIIRDFLKFPQFIANVSGIMSNVLIFLFILVTLVNQFKLKQSLINKIFNFKDHIVHKEKIMDKINLIIQNNQRFKKTNIKNDLLNSDNFEKTQNNETFRTLDTTKNLNVNKKKYYEKYIHIHSKDKFNFKNCTEKKDIVIKDILDHRKAIDLTSKKRPLNFNICELIYSFCCCSPIHLKYRKQVYSRGKDKLDYYLDILTLIKKFQEFDIIKSLIFNKEQLAIIDFLSKPIVSIADDGNKSKLILNDFEQENYAKLVLKDSQISEEEVDNLYNCYLKIKEEKTSDEKDVYLISRLEKKLKFIFS